MRRRGNRIGVWRRPSRTTHLRRGPDLTLQGLCERLGTTARPAHRASDDVAATLELLARLRPDVERTAPARRETVEGLRRAFLPVAQEVAELRREVGALRPPALLDRVLERSGLLRYYSDATPAATCGCWPAGAREGRRPVAAVPGLITSRFPACIGWEQPYPGIADRRPQQVRNTDGHVLPGAEHRPGRPVGRPCAGPGHSTCRSASHG